MNTEIIVRLSKYKRLLQKLKALGLERVFSNNLGDGIGVSPALVRKDFSAMNIQGNKRGGYDINILIEQLNKLLGKDQPQELIIAGCGRIGTALMQYEEFSTEGLQVVAGFDINPDGVQNVQDIPIYHLNEMAAFIKENNIEVGIITVPDNAAANVLEMMIKAGVKGILNFASIELKTANSLNCNQCTIQNVNIGLELEHLFYRIKEMPPCEEKE
ncbi:MAG: redox-sensing transcriptional repressor Rex [Spirochaetales bacterium]|nr:redox-sensing transcriptional repressor Rex [Spirochaetales bacterium]